MPFPAVQRPPTGGLSTLLEDPFFNTFGSFGALSALPRFGELLGPAASGGLMKMDVKESDTSIEVHCDVPGFAKVIASAFFCRMPCTSTSVPACLSVFTSGIGTALAPANHSQSSAAVDLPS